MNPLALRFPHNSHKFRSTFIARIMLPLKTENWPLITAHFTLSVKVVRSYVK